MKFKVFLKRLLVACFCWVESKVAVPFDSFCREYPKTGWGIAVLTIPLLIGGSVYAFTLNISNTQISGENNAAGVSVAAGGDSRVEINQTFIEGQNEPAAVGGFRDNIFQGKKWLLSSSTAVRENDGYLTLLTDSVRFEVDSHFSMPNTYPLHFVPRGIEGMNVEASRRDVYRVVFGDGDYKTIKFRIFDNISSKWVRVFPEGSNNDAHLTICDFKKGDLVQAEVSELYSSLNKSLTLKLNLFCGEKVEKFEYSFNAPENVFEMGDFYIALIDPYFRNETSVYFVQPLISGNLE